MTMQATALRRSFTVQVRVIRALVLREVITRFGRKNLGVLWLIVEPMLFTLGISALWTAADLHHGSSMPIVAFAITGYSSVLLWRNTVTRCSVAIALNMGLLYHRNVQVLDVFIARAIVEVAGITASFATLSAAFSLLGVISLPVDAMKVVAGLLLLTWFGTALGVLIGSAVAYSDIVHRVWHPLAYLVFPISGAAFMVDWLPPAAQRVVLWLPMVHGVELLRDGYFGNTVRTHYDVGYLATFNLVLSLLGLILMRNAADRMERQ